MALFYIDFGKLSNTISEYEDMLEQLESFVDSLNTAVAEMDIEVYEGLDAFIVRKGWNTCATVDAPHAINQLTAIKDALVDARSEFKACKQSCIEFANTFGIGTTLIHLSGMNGVLKCDFDKIVSACEYCYDINEECSDIKKDADEVMGMFSSLKASSQDDLYGLVNAIYTEAINVYDTLEAHKSELDTYGGKVKTADDNLNIKLKEILCNDPKNSDLLIDSMPDYLFDDITIGKKTISNSPEYIFCLNALEKGSIDSNKLDEYNTCLQKILASDEADDFMTYIEKKCYDIEAYECVGLFANTLFVVGSHVNNTHDKEWIDTYKEVNKYLKEDLKITNDPLAAVEGEMILTYGHNDSDNETKMRVNKVVGDLLKPIRAAEDTIYLIKEWNLLTGPAYSDYKNGVKLMDIANKYAGSVPDKNLVHALDVATIPNTLTVEDIDKIYKLNCAGWKDYLNDKVFHQPDSRGVVFIDDQSTLNVGGYSMYYGKENIQYKDIDLCSSFDTNTGFIYGTDNMCEVIATTNAISDHYCKTASLPDIADAFLRMNPVLDGYGGTSPLDIPVILEENGINTVFYYASDLTPEKYRYLCESCDGVIFTAWNGPLPENAIHTMYISIDEDEDSSSGYMCVRHNDGDLATPQSISDENLQVLVEDYSKIPDGAICVIGVMKN